MRKEIKKMKVVLNRLYGGFSLSEEFCKAYPQFKRYGEDQDNQELIKCIEEFGINNAQGIDAEFEIFELPNETTDYYIDEYDGYNQLIYVVDGKLNIF